AAVFEPTYALHSHLSRITGTAVIEGERNDDFSLDLDEVERVIVEHRPAVVFLCSPNNPTGVVDPEASIRRVLELTAANGGLLCVDEAYGQFADFSAVTLLGDDIPLVVSRTYSKTWAMAAVRLGYLLAPSWIIDELEKVVLPYHLDAMTQIAGEVALDHLDAMNDRVARLVDERERLVAALADLPVDVWPSGSNFVLLRPQHLSGDDVWQGLVDRSVLVRNCASWPRLQGCLRVTIGTPDEDDRFLEALTEVLT
ncbi:MAG: aminotransferase class I/II-fold pyridoxal phosphate-dependent enzyme, partial [Actinomycetota bacterium]|nr:aminotransferase class I/II-fold pyridoxal phosphate-dependent enzyme [Actinomycetota bacterium]